jgi:hypothetical protein
MDKAMWDRLAAGGGVVGVVLFVIAGIIYGTPPDADASATSVVDFFQDNRDQVLWAIFLQGLGVLAILWFIAALVTTMRDVGEPRLAVAAFGAYVLGFSIGAAGAMALAGAAFGVAESADPGSVAALYHVGRICDTFSGLLIAGLPAAVAGTAFRTKLFPAWWAWLSALFALWGVVGATAFATDGFWSPDGAGFVGFIAFMVWTLVTSILLYLRTKPAERVVAQPTAG